MLRVKVYSGKDPIGRFILKPGTNEIAEYKTSDEANREAQKLKNGSSLGVWCEIVNSLRSKGIPPLLIVANHSR